MKELLEYILKLIVSHPKEIKIEEQTVGEYSFQYLISAHQDDIGKIIGKEGKIIQAIRNVAKVMAIKEGKQVRIEIKE
jgi:predicted RNA-binding protein YlqC (UPF0109 family)